MIIRRYQHTDRNSLVSLYDIVFPNSTGHNAPELSIDRKQGYDDKLFFVAEKNGELVGTVMGGYDGHRGWIYSLAVSPTHQRAGIGTALVRHVEKALQELGCPKLNLQVRSTNAEVIAFYRSLGFLVEERISLGKRLDSP